MTPIKTIKIIISASQMTQKPVYPPDADWVSDFCINVNCTRKTLSCAR